MLFVSVCLVLSALSGCSATGDVSKAVTTRPRTVTKSPTLNSEAISNAVTADDTEGEAEIAILNVSDAIWKECNCTHNVVDCSNRDLRRPFGPEDWNGLQALGKLIITDVNLSGNFYFAVPQFPPLPIKRLNLSNCEIEILEDAAFSNLQYLAVLDLSRNKMSFVTDRRIFMGISEGGKPMPFEDLYYLSLAYNDMHSLAPDIFSFMPHLTFLDLSGNPFASIDQITTAALDDLSSLKELRISQCDLETLPMGIFKGLGNLQRLDLSSNRFTVVPTALNDAKNLQYLNFDSNLIQALSKQTAISNLTNLQELHICRSRKLRSIAHGALGGLKSLIKLHLRSNPRLTVIDPGFLEWEDEFGDERSPFLEELYLNNNNISKIDSRMLVQWNRLVRVDFTANPYICDCNNQWMVDVLVPLIVGTMANASMLTARMTCRKPYDHRGLTFAQLFESGKKLPCAMSGNGLDIETAMLYGILIGILISFPIVLLVVIVWKKGFFARCRKKMNSEKAYFDDEETVAF